MSRNKLFTVGQLAKRSGVTVRTLHHYDEIGLLQPAIREKSGRRLYDQDSIVRLHQIMNYRTLGLALDQVKRLLDDPAFDREAALIAQRQSILEQVALSKRLIRGIDEALSVIRSKSRKGLDMKTMFGGFDPSQFEDEAKARWGKTKAWAISAKKTADYSESDWKRYHKENTALCEELAALAQNGEDPRSEKSLEKSKAYADMIDRWFYPCSVASLAGFADMYENDARFRETFDAYGDGTAEFVINAFRFAAKV